MKKAKFILAGGSVLLFSMLLVNCTKTKTDIVTNTVTNNPYTGTIFNNEGTYNGIQTLTNNFVANVVADNTINGQFVSAFGSSANNEANFISSLYNFFVTATGGPNIYNGPGYIVLGSADSLTRSMRTVHKGMGITAAQFNALAADLAKAIHTTKWTASDSAGLMGAAASLAPSIIGQ